MEEKDNDILREKRLNDGKYEENNMTVAEQVENTEEISKSKQT